MLSSAQLKSLNLDNTSAPTSENLADWRVQPAGNGAMAISAQTQDGTGPVASLAIMCLRSMPNWIVVRLSVRDHNKDSSRGFNSHDLSPQYFEFQVDEEYHKLDRQQLVSPVGRLGNGAMLGFAVADEELERMVAANTVELARFTSRAVESWTGKLGGTFAMTGSQAVIALALRNCMSQSPAAIQLL